MEEEDHIETDIELHIAVDMVQEEQHIHVDCKHHMELYMVEEAADNIAHIVVDDNYNDVVDVHNLLMVHCLVLWILITTIASIDIIHIWSMYVLSIHHA